MESAALVLQWWRIAVLAVGLTGAMACESVDSGLGDLRVCVEEIPPGSQVLRMSARDPEGRVRGLEQSFSAGAPPRLCADISGLPRGAWRVRAESIAEGRVTAEASADGVQVRSDRRGEVTLRLEVPMNQDCELASCPKGGACDVAYCDSELGCALLELEAERCEPPSPCEANPCPNGGRCSDEDGERRCTCAPGWAGPDCGVCVGGRGLGDRDDDGSADLCDACPDNPAGDCRSEAPVARQPTFRVNTTRDSADALPGDGLCADADGECSVRAAIEESSAVDPGSGPTLIVIEQQMVILEGADNEEAPARVTGSIELRGALETPSRLSLLGAGAAIVAEPGASVILRHLDIRGGGIRGAVRCEDCDRLEVVDTSFDRQMRLPPGTGAALSIVARTRPAQVRVSGALFSRGMASEGGGAIGMHVESAGSVLDVSQSQFRGAVLTEGVDGGFLHVVLAGDAASLDVSIRDAHFEDSLIGGDGGAIYFEVQGTRPSRLGIEILDSRFTDLKAIGQGGALRLLSDQGAEVELSVARSSFHANRSASGGAIAVLARRGGVQAWIGNTTFSENTGDASGGALVLGGTRDAGSNFYDLSACSVVNNDAGEAAGVWVGQVNGNRETTLRIANSVFSGNQALRRGVDLFVNQIPFVSLGGNVLAGGLDFFNDSPPATWHASDRIAGPGIEVDAMLGPVEIDEAGFAAYRPLANSPLIDAAVAEAALPGDQLGRPRGADGNGDGLGGADIGAVELGCAGEDDADGDGTPDACDPCPADPDNFRCGNRDDCGVLAFGADPDGNGVPASCDRCQSASPLDRDADGWPDGCDCDPLDGSTHPGAAERCDNRDNDCDGDIDEGAEACFVVTRQADTVDAVPGDGFCADDDGGCTLRAAVMESRAVPWAVTHVWLPPGEFSLDGEKEHLGVVTDVRIRGAGPASTRIVAGAAQRVFRVHAEGRLSLEALAIEGGRPGANCFDAESEPEGGAICAAGELRLRGVQLAGHQATRGGAIAVVGDDAGPEIHIERSALVGNEASEHGGALFLRGGHATLVSSTLGANTAAGDGGGLYLGGAATARAVHLSVVDNRAEGEGGAVHLSPGATLSIANSVWARNGAASADAAGVEELGGNLLTAADDALGPLEVAADGLSAAAPQGAAVDAALPEHQTSADQHGFSRPLDGDGDGTAAADVGAVERWR